MQTKVRNLAVKTTRSRPGGKWGKKKGKDEEGSKRGDQPGKKTNMR